MSHQTAAAADTRGSRCHTASDGGGATATAATSATAKLHATTAQHESSNHATTATATGQSATTTTNACGRAAAATASAYLHEWPSISNCRGNLKSSGYSFTAAAAVFELRTGLYNATAAAAAVGFL